MQCVSAPRRDALGRAATDARRRHTRAPYARDTRTYRCSDEFGERPRVLSTLGIPDVSLQDRRSIKEVNPPTTMMVGVCFFYRPPVLE